jgi:hypothetical protein
MENINIQVSDIRAIMALLFIFVLVVLLIYF